MYIVWRLQNLQRQGTESLDGECEWSDGKKENKWHPLLFYL